MGGYYTELSLEEQGAVLAAAAGLRLNRKLGKEITRKDLNAAFAKATDGKQLSNEFMRDPAVIQLMSLLAPGRGQTGAFKNEKDIDKTDKNLEARGIPVLRTGTPIGRR